MLNPPTGSWFLPLYCVGSETCRHRLRLWCRSVAAFPTAQPCFLAGLLGGPRSDAGAALLGTPLHPDLGLGDQANPKS